MLTHFVRSAALLAVVARSAHGGGLRHVMQDYLDAHGKSRQDNFATDLLKFSGKCMPQNPRKEDRLCEPLEGTGVASSKVANCNNCAQICHVWGDPHMATFLSPCTINVFTEPDRYTMWEWVAYNEKNSIKFEVDVEKKGSDIGHKPWIVRGYLNGELMLDASTCSKQTTPVQNSIPFSSDANRRAGIQDMEIEYYFGCRHKHDRWALEIWIRIDDDNAPDTSKIDQAKFPYSASTRMLANDRGACVDWLTYGKNQQFDSDRELAAASKESFDTFNCGRKSDKIDQEGHVCKCSAECAVWGDPHVNSFYNKPSRKNKKNFQMPKPAGRTYAQTVLYSVQNRYAVMVEMDECDFISVAHIFIVKSSCLNKMENCGSKAMNSDWLDEDCYDKITVDAANVCSYPEDMEYKTRKILTVPDANNDELGAKYYDETLGGYAAGRYALVDDLLYPVGSSNNVNKCASGAGASSDATSVVNMGVVRSIMKCHMNQIGNPYFNICVQREDMTNEALDSSGAASGSKDTGKNAVKNMEKYARTSGWCATGDYAARGQAATMADSAFTFRSAGMTETFVLASDSPADS